jgi:hypothetical protein
MTLTAGQGGKAGKADPELSICSSMWGELGTTLATLATSGCNHGGVWLVADLADIREGARELRIGPQEIGIRPLESGEGHGD